MPALIIKQGLSILRTRMQGQGQMLVLSVQHGQMLVQKSKPNVTPWQISYCTTDSIPIDLMFQENFPTHTQV